MNQKVIFSSKREPINQRKKKQFIRTASNGIRRRPTLPGRVQPSTIGAEGLNFCVRYGNRWNPFAIATGNCIIFVGLRSVIITHHTCPRYRCFLWESSSPLRLSPLSFRLLTLPDCILRCIKFNACYAFTLRYSRPLSHLDNCTFGRLLSVYS